MLDFSDIFLSLLPDGSLWRPSETLSSYSSVTVTTVSFAAVGWISTAMGWASLTARRGDLVVISGSVSNDGTYTVSRDYDADDPTKLYVDATLIPELAVPSVDVTKQVYAGDLKKLFLACGDNHQIMRDYLYMLAFLRDPKNTSYLTDLEKEYGLRANPALTDTERRDRLDAIVYAPRGTGAASYLEAQLQAGGFNVYVYQNSPATDPGAFFGGPGGELICNHEPYDRTITEARKDQSLWPHVFFIGGEAVLDNSGRIVHIDPVVISEALQPAFREIVLKCKPVHSWALAVINPEGYFTFSDDDSATADTVEGFASADWTTGGWFYEQDVDGYYGWTYVIVEDATGAAVYDAAGEYLTDG